MTWHDRLRDMTVCVKNITEVLDSIEDVRADTGRTLDPHLISIGARPSSPLTLMDAIPMEPCHESNESFNALIKTAETPKPNLEFPPATGPSLTDRERMVGELETHALAQADPLDRALWAVTGDLFRLEFIAAARVRHDAAIGYPLDRKDAQVVVSAAREIRSLAKLLPRNQAGGAGTPAPSP